MNKRVKIIQNCYFNLKYDKGNKQKALQEISNLTKEIKIINVTNIIERLFEVISIIEKNLPLFQSVFKHVDIVSTIIQFLQHFASTRKVACKAVDEFAEPLLNDITDALYTLFCICPDREMQLFLHTAIIEHSLLDDDLYKNISEDNYKQLFSTQTIDMIIFEDSDLYAVVNQLKITGTRMNKIWIHKSVPEQFSWLLNKYFKQSLNQYIYKFETREELLTSKEIHNISILSIWSEDITRAKKLAASLKRDVIFINTHMDFCGGLVFLPYKRLLEGPMYKFLFNLNLYDNVNEIDGKSSKKVPTYNLFYNSMWNKPVKGNYWTHDNCLWANATIEDTNKCIDTAEQGFKIWSTWTVESKVIVLSKFASILKKSNEAMAKKASDLIKYVHFPECSLECLQIGRLEVKITYMPRGIIIIEYENDFKLLQNLILSLIYGNSVIIIFNTFSTYSIKICEISLRIGIPHGVINMLSGKNITCPNDHIFLHSKIRGIIAYFNKEKKVVLPLE